MEAGAQLLDFPQIMRGFGLFILDWVTLYIVSVFIQVYFTLLVSSGVKLTCGKFKAVTTRRTAPSLSARDQHFARAQIKNMTPVRLGMKGKRGILHDPQPSLLLLRHVNRRVVDSPTLRVLDHGPPPSKPPRTISCHRIFPLATTKTPHFF
ncbi:hypothetical protein B0T20DRAFT_8757 [Sordaria brevicollis]|uniref:Uncharacterized protein n=1 Tax=Sordaria brevicollis TaxID=83679 RepID=A0AAE0PMP1_SORBR|nr:hypothetical protein B0T20DRAFT_8757 [Sordaria brevicollis]